MIQTVHIGLLADEITAALIQPYAQFGMLRMRAYYKPTKAVAQAYPRFADPTKTVIRPVITRHSA